MASELRPSSRWWLVERYLLLFVRQTVLYHDITLFAFGLNRFAALAFVLQDIQRCLIDNAADLSMQHLLQLGHHRRQRSLLHYPARITTKRIRTDLLITHTQHRFLSIHGDAYCHGYADFYGQILRNRRLRCYRNRRIVRHMQMSLPALANVQVVVGIEVAQKFCRAFIECAQKAFLGSEVAPRFALAAVLNPSLPIEQIIAAPSLALTVCWPSLCGKSLRLSAVLRGAVALHPAAMSLQACTTQSCALSCDASFAPCLVVSKVLANTFCEATINRHLSSVL